jgi:hypothetical protein
VRTLARSGGRDTLGCCADSIGLEFCGNAAMILTRRNIRKEMNFIACPSKKILHHNK